jgi:hypothetical protein
MPNRTKRQKSVLRWIPNRKVGVCEKQEVEGGEGNMKARQQTGTALAKVMDPQQQRSTSRMILSQQHTERGLAWELQADE